MRSIAMICLLLLSLGSGLAHADTVPADLEMAIQLKVLSFDLGLKSRLSGTTVVIAVLYTPERKGYATEAVNAISALDKSGTTVHGKKVRGVAIPITADLADRLSGVAALYVVDDVSSDVVSTISQIGFARKMPTLSGMRSYLSSGIAVAVVEKKNKPSIVVHAGNSKQCGMVLDSKLLRLAEVVK